MEVSRKDKGKRDMRVIRRKEIFLERYWSVPLGVVRIAWGGVRVTKRVSVDPFLLFIVRQFQLVKLM